MHCLHKNLVTFSLPVHMCLPSWLFQEHPAELCRSEPPVWVYPGHVGPLIPRSGGDSERIRCLLVF